MAYTPRETTCWICGQPYTARRPENKAHDWCERKRRKQAAAENAAFAAMGDVHAKRATTIPIGLADEIEKRLAEIFDSPVGPKVCTPKRITLHVPEVDPLKILIIPDTQVKPDVPTEHLRWAGLYAAQKRPDVIVHLGDHWDMPSLSSYDVGKKSYEGRRYVDDIDAGRRALELFDNEIERVQGYAPRKVFLIGNHEQRIERAVENDRKLEGTIGYSDFKLEQNGWEVHDFLEVVEIAGVEFSHYFTSGEKGNAVSSANALLNLRQGSAIMGHNQKFQIATHKNKHTMAIFAGAFYAHDEKYLSPQDRAHRRQLLVLHEAQDGIFDLMQVSLNFLRRRFA